MRRRTAISTGGRTRLWMNTQARAVQRCPNVRKRDVSLSINRDQINDVLYDGAKIASIYPFPLYPGLQILRGLAGGEGGRGSQVPNRVRVSYLDQVCRADDCRRLTPRTVTACGRRMARPRSTATINGFEGIHSDIVPVLVEMLLANGGFDAARPTSVPTPSQNMADGVPGLYMFGHGASASRTRTRRWNCSTAGSFEARSAPQPATAAGRAIQQPRIRRGCSTTPRRARFGLIRSSRKTSLKALGNLLEATQIDVPIIQWLHRIAYNTDVLERTGRPPTNLADGIQWRLLGPYRHARHHRPEKRLIGRAVMTSRSRGCAPKCALPARTLVVSEIARRFPLDLSTDPDGDYCFCSWSSGRLRPSSSSSRGCRTP